MDSMQQLTALLHRMTELHLRIMTEELGRIGLTHSQILVLGLVKDGPKTVGNISRALSLSYSTVSGIVDQLERQKLVVRNRDASDRRVVWITLTEEFEAFRKTVPFEQTSYYQELFANLTDAEVESVCGALRLICNRLEKKQKALWLEKGEKP